MNSKLKKGFKRGILGSLLTLCLVFSSFITTTPVTAQAATTNYNLATNIQDGVILHCFDWKYNDIKAELPNIAAAGFTSVQTSPAQVGAQSGVWYYLYQPLGFYAGTNDLGTVDELRSLCEEADKYGIKVIVDVIANHLAGDHSNIQNDLKDSQYWHPDFKATDWTNRYHVTYGNIGGGDIGLPDMNTEHSYVQQCVSNYVNSLKSLGVDGIRWDTTKHISLPSEGSNFWPSVTNQGLYHYGEILKGPDDRDSGNEHLMKEYTNYMTVTDSEYGKALRDAFASGNVPTAFGNWVARGISDDKLIYWAESHDTWSNNKDYGYSNEMSQNVIDRAYAIAASRNDITALYFSRPSSSYKETIYAGQKGSTHFTSPEVAAVNHFHNAMIGQPDYYTYENNCAVVCREGGAVIVAGNGGNFEVTVPNGGSTTKPGTYKDEITGAEWTVTETTISGKIGSTGIAVIYNNPGPGDVTTDTIYYQNTNNWDTVYAYYWSDSNTHMTTWPGKQMTAGSDGVYSIEVPTNAKYIIFTNGSGSKTDDLTLQGFDKIYDNGKWSDYNSGGGDDEPTAKTVYYQNTNNWNKVYAYYWSNSNKTMTTWPGEKMTSVGNGVYSINVPSDADYIIFTNGSGTQTDDLTIAGDKKIYNNGNWSDYNDNTIIIDGNMFYQNTSNWSEVYAYYWSSSNTQMTTWPGVKMTNGGNGVYATEIPSDAEYIIFNNGNGTQTGDLTIPGLNMIYNNGNWASYK